MSLFTFENGDFGLSHLEELDPQSRLYLSGSTIKKSIKLINKIFL